MKILRTGLALFFAVLLPGIAWAQQTAGQIYKEDTTTTPGTGVTVIEAEKYTTNVARGGDTWTKTTAATVPLPVSGTGMQALADNGTQFTVAGYSTTAPEMSYEVQFTQTGDHFLWVLGAAPNTAGDGDTVHAGYDGTEVAALGRLGSWSNAFSWIGASLDGPTPSKFTVASAGIHKINIWMREDGFIIDRILITTSNSTTAPAVPGPAETASVPDPRPTVPAGVMASASPASVTVGWGAVGNATSYNLLWSTTNNGPYTTIPGITAVSYTHTPLTPGTTYYYRVQAVNALGTSANSAQVQSTPSAPTPVAPVLSGSASDTRVSLSWAPVQYAVSYTLLRGSAPGGPYGTTVATGITGTSFRETRLANDTTYYYVLRAVNGTGTSPNSNEVALTPTDDGKDRKKCGIAAVDAAPGWIAGLAGLLLLLALAQRRSSRTMSP